MEKPYYPVALRSVLDGRCLQLRTTPPFFVVCFKIASLCQTHGFGTDLSIEIIFQ